MLSRDARLFCFVMVHAGLLRDDFICKFVCHFLPSLRGIEISQYYFIFSPPILVKR
jgi:hypothetical protein